MSKHDTHKHRHHDHAAPPVGTDTATDPVCGMQVATTADARQRDYDSKTWYFCSEGCQTKFDADPYFYTSGAASRVQPGTQ